MTYKEYQEDRDLRRNLERWIENCVMSALDISKIILSSEHRDIPQTYKDMLREFGALFANESFADSFSEYENLRNILAHEYLDLRWGKIQSFLESAKNQFGMFIAAVKKYCADQQAE